MNLTNLQQMHEFCLDYRHTVRSGGTPGPALDALFMEYQKICYAAGIAQGKTLLESNDE